MHTVSNALEIEALTKVYPGAFQALQGLSFTVKRGDFFALLGPNGAGKSTTIGIIASLLYKTSGKVIVYGHDIDIDLDQAKAYIGLVPQEFNCNIFESSLQVIVDQAGYYGIPRREALVRAEYYLQQVGLWQRRYDTIQTLSGGMKRRLMIARALVHDPKLLILDEPTAGVDVELRHFMWDFLQQLNQQGTTIILTTHYLEEAETLCRDIAIINHGRVVVNTDKQTLLNELHQETYLFNCRDLPKSLPKIEKCTIEVLDLKSLSIQIQGEHSVSDVIHELAANGVEVMQIRLKTNPLEELFLRLTADKEFN